MSKLEHLVRPAVAQVKLSAIKEMAIRSAQTADAVSLSWGLPSFRTPAHIRAAVAHALESDLDIGKYALPAGLPELRQLVANTHAEKTGIAVDPDRNVLITSGNMEGVSTLFRVILEPGSEVIVTDPGFVSHYQQIALRGARAIPWQLDEANDWKLQPDLLEALITPLTKAIILVTPCNPTGTLFGREQLLQVGEIALKHDLLIIIDDPYSNFTYDNKPDFFNLASEQALFDNLTYLFTFSKSYAMSGWRVGYLIAAEDLRREALKVHDATMICAPRISQVAGIAALSGPADHLQEFETKLGQRRTLICERLDRLRHIFDYIKPQGAYYVFPRILVEHKDAFEFALRLLRDTKVAVTPGSAFGPSGEHHVRMAFCVDEDTINLAFDRIEQHFGS